MHELFSSSSGNPDLTEERATKMELTVEIPYNFNKFYGSISQAIFYNRIEDLIEKQNDQYTNFNKVDSYGFELTGKLHLITDHQVSFSYLDYTESSNIGLLNISRNSVTISEKYILPWEIKLEYKAAWMPSAS